MSQNSESFTGLIIVVAVIWGGGGVWSSGWFNQGWYAVTYGVYPSKVSVDKRPPDCDFLHAPLGSKGCSYNAVVTAYNANGDLVGGDSAPKYSHDVKTGKPIISWDKGKTWAWADATDVPDQRIVSVKLEWVKNTD